MIKPYDLGSFNNLVEYSQKIRIDELVAKAKRELKVKLVQSIIEALGTQIKLTTSKTRFNGERFWFVCPMCNKRVGTLYKHPLEKTIGCRICLNLQYGKQRFKGMIEANCL